MRDDVFIIAEAGVNHNGDMNLARELVHAAAESFVARSLLVSAPKKPVIRRAPLVLTRINWR